MAVFHEEEQNKKLAEIHVLQEEAAIQSIAHDYGMSYVDLSGVGINTDALLLIPEEISRSVGMACFAMLGKKLSVAVQSPTKTETLQQVDLLEEKGFTVQMFLVSVRSLEKAWARYADVSGAFSGRSGLLDISDEALQELAEKIHTNADIREQFEAMVKSGESHKISKLMEIIFGASIATRSSDVHIEAGEHNARLRFRQDGVLQDILEFSLEIYKSINARIKLLSELKLTDTVLAQDGRFTIFYKELEIEVRVSLIPGPYGESIVMRILNPEGLAKDFEHLGMQRKLLEVLLVEIEKPNGMILNTGPTGSGKTTTLYSILKRVYTPEIKILTIEDPIEYHLPGITQTQIDHDTGYDFSAGLRAAMRQDPDVIMVGEIRDKETASTAINASLTGHLVLSTLHTNNAAGAIPRLTELGVSKNILPDALTVVMAQRMIRRLCEHCKAVTQPDDHEKTILRAIVANAIRNKKDFSDSGITDATKDFTIYKPVGCDQCDQIGYKGRIGIFEAITIDDTISEIIERNPSERDIKHGAIHQGIFTMVEDGVAKILSGITTLEEVQSTVDMVEDLPEGWNTPDFLADTFIAKKNSLTPDQLIVSSEVVSKGDISSAIQVPAVPVTPVLPVQPTVQVSDMAFFPSDGAEALSDITLPMRELSLMVDYLQVLETQQKKNPDQGIKSKITEIKETIVDLIQRYPPAQWVTSVTPQIHDDIHSIVQQLEVLEQHQSKRPNVGVAKQLQEIRQTIENILVKE
jgi:type IV pilus assembly protein PilB